MAKKNKIIKFKDGSGKIMTISTKRLDAVYLMDTKINFLFTKRSIHSGEYNSREEAEKVRSQIVAEWMGLSE